MYSPRMESAGLSGRALKSMPAILIMRASSRVVRTTSTSWWPEARISSERVISYFFAVQGMMEVRWMRAGSRPIFSAK